MAGAKIDDIQGLGFQYSLKNRDKFIMLKFLDNRPEDQSPKRSPIKFKP